MAEYDAIAADYWKTLSTTRRKYVYDYSLFKHLGNVKGKDVLELACGEGTVSRQLKARGAQRVVGVDISQAMIDKAAEQEKQNPQGIQYVCSKGTDYTVNEQFDIVIGSYYFHYAQTVEELTKMFHHARQALKQNGLLVAMNVNPFHPIAARGLWASQYSWLDEPMKDGSRIQVDSIDDKGKVLCTFTNYHYNSQTYNHAMAEQGFTDVKWNKPEVSPEAISNAPEGFWNGFTEIEPSVLILTARKE